MRIDSINGDNNNKWAESEKWEAQQLLEYKAFLDLRDTIVPMGNI